MRAVSREMMNVRWRNIKGRQKTRLSLRWLELSAFPRKRKPAHYKSTSPVTQGITFQKNLNVDTPPTSISQSSAEDPNVVPCPSGFDFIIRATQKHLLIRDKECFSFIISNIFRQTQ